MTFLALLAASMNGQDLGALLSLGEAVRAARLQKALNEPYCSLYYMYIYTFLKNCFEILRFHELI